MSLCGLKPICTSERPNRQSSLVSVATHPRAAHRRLRVPQLVAVFWGSGFVPTEERKCGRRQVLSRPPACPSAGRRYVSTPQNPKPWITRSGNIRCRLASRLLSQYLSILTIRIRLTSKEDEHMSIAQTLLAEFEGQVPITRKFLERLPADQIASKPHEKSITAGRLALRLASVPGAVMQSVQEDQGRFSTFRASRCNRRISDRSLKALSRLSS